MSGKILFWWWLSSLPNFSSFTILPVWGLARQEDTEVRIDLGQSPDQPQQTSFFGAPADGEEGGVLQVAGTLLGSVLGGSGGGIGGGIGGLVGGALLGGVVGSALSGGGLPFIGRKRKRRRRRRRREARQTPPAPQMELSLGFGDVMDGVMTDFLALAEIRMALARKGIISEED